MTPLTPAPVKRRINAGPHRRLFFPDPEEPGYLRHNLVWPIHQIPIVHAHGVDPALNAPGVRVLGSRLYFLHFGEAD
jgi:hypothetical protein